jgi:small subunit ribosomal protein S14
MGRATSRGAGWGGWWPRGAPEGRPVVPPRSGGARAPGCWCPPPGAPRWGAGGRPGAKAMCGVASSSLLRIAGIARGEDRDSDRAPAHRRAPPAAASRRQGRGGLAWARVRAQRGGATPHPAQAREGRARMCGGGGARARAHAPPSGGGRRKRCPSHCARGGAFGAPTSGMGGRRTRDVPTNKNMKQRKTAHLQKDLNRRQVARHFERKRQTLKTILHNLHLPPLKRFVVLLHKRGASPSKVRVRNRCVLTGRSRGIHKFFKISRIMIRDLAAKGLLPGVKKAS